LVVAGLGLLVFVLPVVAAVLFVTCAAVVAVVVGRSEGFWRGWKLFIKEVLFGW
jgi:hypothetical protein